MKKLIFFLLIASLICCTKPTVIDHNNGKSSLKSAEFTEAIHEGCEYLIYDRGVADQRVFAITHKGNCSNIIHK